MIKKLLLPLLLLIPINANADGGMLITKTMHAPGKYDANCSLNILAEIKQGHIIYWAETMSGKWSSTNVDQQSDFFYPQNDEWYDGYYCYYTSFANESSANEITYMTGSWNHIFDYTPALTIANNMHLYGSGNTRYITTRFKEFVDCCGSQHQNSILALKFTYNSETEEYEFNGEFDEHANYDHTWPNHIDPQDYRNFISTTFDGISFGDWQDKRGDTINP